jgi:hypothetical protein
MIAPKRSHESLSLDGGMSNNQTSRAKNLRKDSTDGRFVLLSSSFPRSQSSNGFIGERESTGR